jgi:class 3 adenylate cyclase
MSHLQAGFVLYNQAYQRARQDRDAGAAWYTGINAATMAAFRGDLTTARAIAGEVRNLCGRADTSKESGSARYWREATLGEASLILGDAVAARAHYSQALASAGRRFGDLSSTRRQAKLLARHLPPMGVDVDAMLRIPSVVIFSGHMIDRSDRSAARFPAKLEPAVAKLIRKRFAEIAPVAAYGSAACGADILCLESAREMGCETHIVLPFPPAAFRRTSVDFAGADWGERFERELAAADSVTVASDHYARGSSATFDYANLILTGMGRLRAQTLDTELRALAIRDPEDPSTPGGTTSNLSLWRAGAIEIDEVRLSDLRTAATPPRIALGEVPGHGNPDAVARHEMRAMLFADAVGYSKLSEDQIPGYIAGFLGAVGELSRRTKHPFEHVETSGDGLYMVFRHAADAAHFALELSATTHSLDRAKWGLPESFDLRIALHCGPVHCAIDPITGLPLYTGPHTSRAARIEPITPPGQVYASSAFAAVAAATNAGISMNYVGRIPLAKGYGTLGLHHVKAAPTG